MSDRGKNFDVHSGNPRFAQECRSPHASVSFSKSDRSSIGRWKIRHTLTAISKPTLTHFAALHLLAKHHQGGETKDKFARNTEQNSRQTEERRYEEIGLAELAESSRSRRPQIADSPRMVTRGTFPQIAGTRFSPLHAQPACPNRSRNGLHPGRGNLLSSQNFRKIVRARFLAPVLYRG